MDNVEAIITTKCELLVKPCEDLHPSLDRAYLEFVVGDNIDSFSNKVITYAHEENGETILDIPQLYQFKLPRDQHYIYIRWWIKTKNIETFGNDNKNLYYNTTDKMLYFDGNKITTSEQLESIVADYERWGSEYGILNPVTKSVYSLCRITKCLENLQRKFIFETCADNRIEYCEDNKNDKFIRDFLFSSVFVLKQLISQQRYEEADKILKKLDSCGVICGNAASITKNDCGCK